MPRSSTPLGPCGPDQRTGSGGGPAQQAQPCLEWLGVGMHQDPRTPQPTHQAPHASTLTLPVTGMSWKPFGPPGLARWLLVWCWWCSVAGRRQQAGVLSQVVQLKYSMPPKERCGLLARPAGQSERAAKSKALRVPHGNRLTLADAVAGRGAGRGAGHVFSSLQPVLAALPV